MAGSTAAGFDQPNLPNSYVDLTQGGVVSKELFNDSMPMTISLWFKTTDLEAPLVTFSQDPISKGSTTASGLDPALYIGDSGKLHAEFWTPSGTAPITTANPVNDGNWHHVALAYNASSGGVQTLYLDGAVVGTFPGTVSIGGAPYEYLGAGYLGGPWPDESFQNQTPVPTYFQGTMADVAYFTTALDAAAVSAMYNAGHASGQLLSGMTKPSGNVAASLSYDQVSGRVTTLTDGNGGTWKMGQPTVAGSSQVFVNSVLGASPQAYWRLNDASGTTAKNQLRGADGTYSSVTLGAASPFADGTSAASFDIRTQPCDTACPSSCGALVPWMPTTPPPGHSLSFE